MVVDWECPTIWANQVRVKPRVRIDNHTEIKNNASFLPKISQSEYESWVSDRRKGLFYKEVFK